MKVSYALGNGKIASFTVRCSRADVEAFAERWPCFGTARPYWFQFDAEGNLIDTNHRGTHRNDGSGIVALCDDAKTFGAGKLNLSFP